MNMNKHTYAIAAVAVIGVMLSAGIAFADNGDDEEMTGAGGGGWFMYADVDGAKYKDTFGFYLNSSDWSGSELVLQARDMGVTIHAVQFDNIVFNYDAVNGVGSAEAWGLAMIGGVEASFHLLVEDNGVDRTMDHLLLEVTSDVTSTWDVMGLGGGQIWVYLP